MLSIYMVLVLGSFFVAIFYVLNFVLSLKVVTSSKSGAFESGFESIGKIHSSFSIHFFIIMLMFVIFDLEVVLLMGLLVSDFSSSILYVLTLLVFIMGSFYMEWHMGKLVWLV